MHTLHTYIYYIYTYIYIHTYIAYIYIYMYIYIYIYIYCMASFGLLVFVILSINAKFACFLNLWLPWAK